MVDTTSLKTVKKVKIVWLYKPFIFYMQDGPEQAPMYYCSSFFDIGVILCDNQFKFDPQQFESIITLELNESKTLQLLGISFSQACPIETGFKV
jgi:hypothetical protein